jgi:glycosyltransferase involved in cell wall biosynthesis
MYFSLVITTYNRFDTFLKENIIKYLENPYISEIIISDDCSDDYDKLINYFDNSKIKIIKQEKNIGALRNKISACTYATNNWICLMDSDNFADINYFEALINYWKSIEPNETIIYCPSKAMPSFDFTEYINTYVDKNNFNNTNECLLNDGNHVFHKNILNHLLPILENDINPYAVDVKFMVYNWLKNDIKMTIIQDMIYYHAMHNESLYIQNASNSINFDKTYNWNF